MTEPETGRLKSIQQSVGVEPKSPEYHTGSHVLIISFNKKNVKTKLPDICTRCENLCSDSDRMSWRHAITELYTGILYFSIFIRRNRKKNLFIVTLSLDLFLYNKRLIIS